ncbi:MAG: N-acetylmuramoyl-L-alanine amidase [Elusimicrobiota bacterium]
MKNNIFKPWLLTLSLATLFISPQLCTAKKIFLNPSNQTNNSVCGGGNEAQYALLCANKAATKLQAKGHTTKVLQAFDGVPTQSNTWGANAFISMHTNAYKGGCTSAAAGIATFYNATSKASDIAICKKVQPELVACMKLSNRSGCIDWFGKNLYVLSGLTAPGCLEEALFHDHTTEAAILRSSTGQEKIASSVTNGIQSYFGLTKIPCTESTTTPAYKATYVTKSFPATMISGTTAQAYIEYTNSGTASWTSSTRLGTTQARNRASSFYNSTDWLSSSRPTAVNATTAANGTGRFTFILKAPIVTVSTKYTEYFNLVQDGTTVVWFSDQGGPADNIVSLAITVQPVPVVQTVVKGYVYNASNALGNVAGNRIAGAKCNLTGAAVNTAYTDANGLYTITDTAAGSYTLTVSSTGFLNNSKQFTVVAATTNWISLGLNFAIAGDTTPPLVPALATPTNSVTLTSVTNIAFDWDTVTDPSGVMYSLQVDKTNDFSDPEIELLSLTNSQYIHSSTLHNGTYYWRISAVDGAENDSGWSTSRVFYIDQPDSLPPVNPTTCSAWSDETKAVSLPNNIAQSISTIAYFEWAGASDLASGVYGYSVYWGTEPNGDPGTSNVQTDNTYKVTTPVANGSVYYLRIRTRDNKGNWSAADTMYTFRYNINATGLTISNISVLPSSGIFSPNGDGVNDAITVNYTLSDTANITLKILNNNELVRTILNSVSQSTGQHSAQWDGKDNNGLTVTSRPYTFQVEAYNNTSVALPKTIRVTVNNSSNTITGPVIAYTPTLSIVGIHNDNINISCEVTPSSATEVTEVYIRYRLNDGTSWNEWQNVYTNNSEGNTYTGDIPADKLTSAVKEVEYCIGAIDDNGWDSYSDLQSIKLGSSSEKVINTYGGIIKLIDGNPQDGDAKIIIPLGVVYDTTKFVLTQRDIRTVPWIENNYLVDGNNVLPVAAYEITTTNGTTTFDKPITLNFLYFDLDNDGLVDSTNTDEHNLGIFWHDGNEWRYLGGKVDTDTNVISATVNHLTLFGVFPVKNIELSARDYAPKEKVITPNSDGKNDYAMFNGLQNYFTSISADSTESKEIRVYNISNMLIRILTDTDMWDGKNSNGEYVENGVYIYQYVVKGQLASGTVVIAR